MSRLRVSDKLLPALRIARVTHRRKPIRFPMAAIWDKRRTLPRYAEDFCKLLGRPYAKVFPIAQLPSDRGKERPLTIFQQGQMTACGPNLKLQLQKIMSAVESTADPMQGAACQNEARHSQHMSVIDCWSESSPDLRPRQSTLKSSETSVVGDRGRSRTPQQPVRTWRKRRERPQERACNVI
jgi:hypothetical protein